MIKIVFSSLLLVISFYAMSDEKNESIDTASKIASKILKSAKEKNIISVAKDISSLKEKRVNEGILNQFNSQTLSAFNINKESIKNENMANNQLVMFVSSSIPLKTLRNYARDLHKVGGVMVMRGMKGGLKNYTENMRFVWDVIRVDLNCKKSSCKTYNVDVLIDPVIFRMYEVKTVPALVYQPNMNLNSYCDDVSSAHLSKGIVFGDAYLGTLIEELYQKTNEDVLQELLHQLESSE